MVSPGVPAHVVQRGHNQDAGFFAEDDARYYRQMFGKGLKRYDAELPAYCLLTNHVHLLITPESADSLSWVVQHLGRQNVQCINRELNGVGVPGLVLR